MSDNPFDVFAADFKAAIPTTDDKSNQNEQPINIMAAPSPAPVPVMNAPAAPVMNQQQPQQPPVSAAAPTNNMNSMAMNGGGMGMMGSLNPQYGMNGGMGMGAGMGAGMGMPPPSQQQQPPSLGGAPPTMMNGGMGGNMMGGGMMGMGGGMQQPPAPGAMVPSAQPSNPYAMSMNMGLPQQQQQQPPAMGGMGMGLSMNQPPAAPPAVQTPAPPTGGSMAPDFGVAPTTTAAPPESAPAAPPTQPPPPFGQPAPPTAAPTAAAATADPFGGQPAPPVPPSADPFGQSAPPVPPTTEAADPWAQPPSSTTQPPLPAPVPAANDAIVPVPNGAVNDDPFGVFTQGPPPAAAAADVLSVATPNPAHNYTSEQVQAAADDPWNSTPFGSSSPSNNNAAPAAPSTTGGGGLLGDDSLVPAGGGAPAPTDDHKAGELPPGGEWYDARIFTPTLGVMFFKPQELTDSLFLQTERSLVNALDDRPVVAFIVEGSSARAAGVELGHVLLKVNGIDVKNPKEASRLIKEGPRPLPLLFYVPDTNVVVAEGEHMVKYDTRDTTAPNSAKDWKPKYVVIGGIIAQPWMMNMYRSKVSKR